MTLRDRLRNGRQDEGFDDPLSKLLKRLQPFLEPDEKVESVVRAWTAVPGKGSTDTGVWILVTDRSVVRIDCWLATHRPKELKLRLPRTARLLNGPLDTTRFSAVLHPHFGRTVPVVMRENFRGLAAVDQKIAALAHDNPA